MDTRRKITVELDFYAELRSVAKKEKHTLGKMLEVLLAAYKEIKPRQKDMEKRITRLEKQVKVRPSRGV